MSPFMIDPHPIVNDQPSSIHRWRTPAISFQILRQLYYIWYVYRVSFLFREYCRLVVGLVYILPFDHDMQVDHTYHRWWCAFSGESPLSAGGFSWSYPLRRECELTPEWRGHFWRWRADFGSRGGDSICFCLQKRHSIHGTGIYKLYIPSLHLPCKFNQM